ncbi:hypothetical protein QTI66_32600 [Variovorax sp. J22R133]|uniref:hypothetical protein n=1 Tax=Variovorax brevis TaxID=3053503 RepID=UPI0025750AE9|nr:hypothetical protein [Variovorax sp. J22R133]MDM0116868.1 hypothetical protein [Variovorax sp. J22R133]
MEKPKNRLPSPKLLGNRIKPPTGKNPWNSLEAAKLMAAMFVPLSVAFATLAINFNLRKVEEARQRDAFFAEYAEAVGTHATAVDEFVVWAILYYEKASETDRSARAATMAAADRVYWLRSHPKLQRQVERLLEESKSAFATEAMREATAVREASSWCLNGRDAASNFTVETKCRALVERARTCSRVSIELVSELSRRGEVSDRAVASIVRKPIILLCASQESDSAMQKKAGEVIKGEAPG